MTWQEDGDMHKGEAELLVRTVNLFANVGAPKKLLQLSHPRYKLLSSITNGVCCQLLEFQRQQPSGNQVKQSSNQNDLLVSSKTKYMS